LLRLIKLQIELLRMIDPLTVRLVSIDVSVIRLVVDKRLRKLEFNAEAEARAAFDDWIKLNPKVQQA
jgi:hypothetical protein